MAWQTPKTNWATGDIPVADDFNRIEGNVQELQNTKETPAGAQAKANTAEANAKAYTDAHEQKAAPHSGHETPAGAQAKAEAAAGAVQADLDAHLAEEAQAHGGVDAASILSKLKTVDGAGSGLDADLIQGKSGVTLMEGAIPGTATLLASYPNEFTQSGSSRVLCIRTPYTGRYRLEGQAKHMGGRSSYVNIYVPSATYSSSTFKFEPKKVFNWSTGSSTYVTWSHNMTVVTPGIVFISFGASASGGGNDGWFRNLKVYCNKGISNSNIDEI